MRRLLKVPSDELPTGVRSIAPCLYFVSYSAISQTEMCFLLFAVKGSRFQFPQRWRRVIPAMRAIKSSSDGQTNR
jgi:hypothetical protein